MPLWTPNPSSSSPSRWTTFWRAHSPTRSYLLHHLSQLQYISAIPLAIFLTIHLAPPAVVPLLGPDSANQLLLTAREVYQTPLIEPILFASLGTHFLSGLLHRLLLLPHPPPSIAHFLGYPLLGLLALHLDANRFHAPKLGGASMEYVAAGLRAWPVSAGVVYAGIVGAGLWHAYGCGKRALARRFPSRRAAQGEGKADTEGKTVRRGWMWPVLVLSLAGWCGLVSMGYLAMNVKVMPWREAELLESWKGSALYF